MPIDTSFRFDSVVVIESLPDGEERTGRWLVAEVLQPLADADRNFGVEYFVAPDLAGLLRCLDEVERRFSLAAHSPILHFESHGSEAGLQLADGSLVPWERLRVPLTRMNRACGVNLLVVMAMCHGRWLSNLLLPHERAPVWAVIGPVDPVLPSRLQDAFENFYRTLLGALNGRDALFAMNASRGDRPWDLGFDDAERIFCRVFREYLAVAATDEALRERENALVARVVAETGADLTRASSIRSAVRADLRDHAAVFERCRQHFLLLDEFPGNAQRFKLSYEDCSGVV